MTARYRVDHLEDVLSSLCEGAEGIVQAVIVSAEGFVVASHSRATHDWAGTRWDSTTVAATAAIAMDSGMQTLLRLESGKLERLIIEGSGGAMILLPVAEADVALAVIVAKDAKVGLAARAMRLNIGTIAAILSPRTGERQ